MSAAVSTCGHAHLLHLSNGLDREQVRNSSRLPGRSDDSAAVWSQRLRNAVLVAKTESDSVREYTGNRKSNHQNSNVFPTGAPPWAVEAPHHLREEEETAQDRRVRRLYIYFHRALSVTLLEYPLASCISVATVSPFIVRGSLISAKRILLWVHRERRRRSSLRYHDRREGEGTTTQMRGGEMMRAEGGRSPVASAKVNNNTCTPLKTLMPMRAHGHWSGGASFGGHEEAHSKGRGEEAFPRDTMLKGEEGGPSSCAPSWRDLKKKRNEAKIRRQQYQQSSDTNGGLRCSVSGAGDDSLVGGEDTGRGSALENNNIWYDSSFMAASTSSSCSSSRRPFVDDDEEVSNGYKKSSDQRQHSRRSRRKQKEEGGSLGNKSCLLALPEPRPILIIPYTVPGQKDLASSRPSRALLLVTRLLSLETLDPHAGARDRMRLGPTKGNGEEREEKRESELTRSITGGRSNTRGVKRTAMIAHRRTARAEECSSNPTGQEVAYTIGGNTCTSGTQYRYMYYVSRFVAARIQDGESYCTRSNDARVTPRVSPRGEKGSEDGSALRTLLGTSHAPPPLALPSAIFALLLMIMWLAVVICFPPTKKKAHPLFFVATKSLLSV